MKRGQYKCLTAGEKFVVCVALKEAHPEMSIHAGILPFVDIKKVFYALSYFQITTSRQRKMIGTLFSKLANACTSCGKGMDQLRFETDDGMICHRCKGRNRRKSKRKPKMIAVRQR